MSLRIGVLANPFDPVRSSQLELCFDAIRDGSADRILLVMNGNPSVSGVSLDNRWKMLVAACAGNKKLIPYRLPVKKESAGTEKILKHLQKKHPEDRLFLLSSESAGLQSSLPPAVEEYCSLSGLYGFPCRIEKAGIWISDLFTDLTPHRFAHSLSVAYSSVKLALRFGINIEKAEIAGLLHDCAKCLPLAEMQETAVCSGVTNDLSILGSSALLHSLVGARIAHTRYGIDDQEILDAIAFHNTGHAGMSRLAMCVCLADFIEPNRESFPLLEEVRCLSEKSLEQALLLSLKGVADHVCSKGQVLHPRTMNAISWLESLPTSAYLRT